MKNTRPSAFLTADLLRFVRDTYPSVEELTAAFGTHRFHVLRKQGAVVVEGDHVRLSRRHLSPDGRVFVWGTMVIHLDRDVIDMVRWGPTGAPIYSEEP